MPVPRLMAVLSSIAVMAVLPGIVAAATAASVEPSSGAAAVALTRSVVTALPNDDATAESLLLAASDFPADWRETAYSGGQPNPLDQCSVDVPGRSGLARGATFSPDGGMRGIAETVSVFDTPADAGRSAFLIHGVLDCTVGVLQALATPGVAMPEASYSEEPFPAFGNGTFAYRLHFSIYDEQSGVTTDDYIDFVYVINGRVGFSVQAGNLSLPFDMDVLQSVVAQANSKIQSAVEALAGQELLQGHTAERQDKKAGVANCLGQAQRGRGVRQCSGEE